MKFRLHAKQFLSLALKHPPDRNAGPLGHNLRYIFRSHGFRDYRVLDCCLASSEFFDLLLRLRHLAVSYLRHLAVITCPLGIMSLDLIVLDLLAGGLELGQNVFFLVPTLSQLVSLSVQFLQFSLDPVRLERYTLTPDCLLLDLKLPDTAVQFRNRLRHRIHLKAQFGSRLIHKVNGLVRQEPAGYISM